LISETKDRWAYCAAFGMMANTFLQVTTAEHLQAADSFKDAISSGLCP